MGFATGKIGRTAALMPEHFLMPVIYVAQHGDYFKHDVAGRS